MKKFEHIRVVAFDADDTLWANETIFAQTEEEFKALLSDYTDVDKLGDRLYETEGRNLRLFGYGIKGFTLSMIETAVQLSDGRLTAMAVQRIIDMGKSMLRHPVELLDGVRETIEALAPYYQLMIITKGDLFDQENKIARSGLADHFQLVEILSEKDEASYRQAFQRHGLRLEEVLMVGNSLKSDVLPICRLGGQAVHIPFHTTWVHEKVGTQQANGYEYEEIEDIRQLIRLLNPAHSPALDDEEVLIEGNGFRLRRFRRRDIPSLAKHANNPKIASHLQDRFPHPYTEADARKFIEYARRADMETVFAIDVDGQAVGAVGIIFKSDVYRLSGEIGYWLAEPFWGRGIATQAVRAMARHAFEDLGLIRVFARVFSNNKASVRVLEKAGFTYEGTGRQAVVKNGAVLGLLHYAALKEG